jgi:hypothetical protein
VLGGDKEKRPLVYICERRVREIAEGKGKEEISQKEGV